MTSRRAAFVVDTTAVAREREKEVCRFALQLVRDHAKRFETDLPLSNAKHWPADVRAAADRLARHATGCRDGHEHYQQTGVVPTDDEVDWESFVHFAPYAFDASVWAADGLLIELSDEGSSLVVHLTADQQSALTVFEPGLRVVRARTYRPKRRW